tara:strand:+ start:387 stop:608 length:222 start_codon:yes stop_codon:yes gene_type:complete
MVTTRFLAQRFLERLACKKAKIVFSKKVQKNSKNGPKRPFLGQKSWVNTQKNGPKTAQKGLKKWSQSRKFSTS